MPIGVGTNMFNAVSSTVEVNFTNGAGDAVMARATTAGIPSSVAGYAVGCMLQNSTTGSMFINRGSATSCTFKDVQTYA